MELGSVAGVVAGQLCNSCGGFLGVCPRGAIEFVENVLLGRKNNDKEKLEALIFIVYRFATTFFMEKEISELNKQLENIEKGAFVCYNN